MDISYLANLAEIFGTAAIVVSLIYVAVQIRQNTRATRLSTAQNVFHDLRESTAMIANDAEMAQLHLKGMVDDESLSPVERYRFYTYLNNAFRVYENAFYQNQEGALDAYVWEGVVANMLLGKDTSGYQAFWRDRKQIFSEKFQNFIDKELPAPEVDTLDAYRAAEEDE